MKRYAAYCKARKVEGTRFALQAATFFGPDERWREEWPEINLETGEGLPPEWEGDVEGYQMDRYRTNRLMEKIGQKPF